MSKNILCFTASYPYGSKETYFDNELRHISKNFDKVFIMPLYNPYSIEINRTLPPNVVVLPVSSPQGLNRIVKGIFNFSPVGFFISDFIKARVFLNKKKVIKWINSLLVYRAVYKDFKSKSETIGSDCLLYSYWAEIPLFAAKSVQRYTKITRLHAGDFYLDRNNGYLPLRQEIYTKSDVLLPISNDIKNRLIYDYKISSDKIFLNYLGTGNSSSSCALLEWDKVKLVSCSNLTALKRIHLIIDLLKIWKEDVKIEWHHIGGGKEMSRLKNDADFITSPNVEVFFHGTMSQTELFSFYEKNAFHWFLNFSEYEGVPVSIMESFSFGIPVIATNVGATKELVNSDCGYLISKDFKLEEIAELITKNWNSRNNYLKMRENAYKQWAENFRDEDNYRVLCGIFNDLLNDKNNVG
ncbi:glycosyltransferase [Pedobacter sp. B4-66]|uniref:glycosyltransferase n=1 Tax=Pedobacter sp. B4-66 TaxID=2817280 RepID=UPI001BD996AD|nr:glycosyltransferase [Pedobacter sp. B4-66]